MLFTDGSVHVETGVGIGAMLLVFENEISIDLLKQNIRLKRFEQTSSTKLELQTLLWALDEIQITGEKVIVYSDSQNILGLLQRREKLEQNDYFTKGNKRLKNWELYIQFFLTIDKLNCDFVKVKGHKKSSKKNETDRYFTLVDRASRNALRKEMSRNG